MAEHYREVIREIDGLNWQDYTPESIIHVSYLTAMEFANTLRQVLEYRPIGTLFTSMAAGELDTDNLQFEDYSGPGDHWQFLHHFVEKVGLARNTSAENRAVASYLGQMRKLKPGQAAMTIVSRERVLSDIFLTIVEAHDWKKLGYGFYQYYLVRHVQLDSSAGGHADTLRNFQCNPDILDVYWTARLQLYRDMLKPLGAQTL